VGATATQAERREGKEVVMTTGTGSSGTGSSEGGGEGRGGKRGIFDDLAGMAGGAFSVMAAVRTEAEAMAKAQAEAMVQRLDLVRREDLDAALEVARRAREQAETLGERVSALEHRLAALEAPGPDATP
jgi:BMFP domain-containing protein YqiC